MPPTRYMRFTVLGLLTSVAACQSSTSGAQAAPSASADRSEIVWGPAPAVFPPGAQMAVLQGDPSKAGVYTVRLRMPNGYRIAPHTHPTDEHVTVISGTFRVAMGETFEEEGMAELRQGGFITAPANMAHYAMARGQTVVQVHGMGPFQLTYVNPADMPKAGSR